MNLKLTVIFFTVLVISSCGSAVKEGMIIFTQVTSEINGSAHSRIAALDPKNPGKMKVLSEGFIDACSPVVSFDAKFIVFSGRRTGTEQKQIWKLNLKNLKASQITNEKYDCTDPVILPGDQTAFSGSIGKEGKQSLFTCKTDGTGLKQITFDPYAYFSSSVLGDGRLISVRRQKNSPEKELAIVLRPDGTKAEIFLNASDGTVFRSSFHEAIGGRLYYVEGDKDSVRGDIICINYNRPMHSSDNLTSSINLDFRDAVPMKNGNLLVSFKESEGGSCALGEFDPWKKKMIRTIFSDPSCSSIQPVIAEAADRPKKLPSEVDYGVKTGLLLCQDINYNFPADAKGITLSRIADKIEIMGTDSAMGVVEVEKDGSFYLKVIADTPFRIITLDKNGNVINGPCGWIYLRPNERRGCIGCHEDPELVPENRLPLAVKKAPVNIPVHVSRIKEKEISLE